MCGVLLFLVSVHIASVYIFAVRRFSITYDPAFSTALCNEIELYVGSKEKRALGFNQLDKDLQRAFPCISAIRCQCNSNGEAFLHVQAVQPLIKLNDKQIVTALNDVVPLYYYVASEVQHLPHLRVAMQDCEKHLSQTVFDYMRCLDADDVKHMLLSWKDSNEIQIAFDNQNVQLLCNAQTVPNRSIVTRCAEIAHEIHLKSPSVTSCIADVRFDNQIVISKIKS